MNTVYLVASHTPTLDKQDALRRLVRTLKKNNKDIFLITHSHTPSDIISDVKYHFFDSENEFLDGEEYTSWFNTSLFDKTLVSKDVIKQSTSILPCTRNLFFGMFISKMLGYDNLHYIEYDTEITDFMILDKNTELMSEFDGVHYTVQKGFHNNEEHLFGAYSVYNLNSYSYDELLWEREKILNEFANVDNNTLVEKVTQSLLIKNKNFFSQPRTSIDNQGLNFDTIKSYSDYFIDPKILFIDNGKVHLYCCNKNPNLNDEIIEVIINNQNYQKLPPIKPNIFYLKTLGEIKDINLVKLYSNNKLIFEYDLSIPENVNKLIKNNYLK